MNLGQPFESAPGRRFADRDVGIVRNKRLPMGGVDHAHSEARAHQRIEHCDLVLVQWKYVVIGGKNRRRSRERIFLTENSVGGGNRGLANRKGRVHIAKIDNADDPPGLRPGRRHERVVVVGVPINDTLAKMGKIRHRLRFEEVEKPLRERAPLDVRDIGKILAGPKGAGKIPFEFALRGRMTEIQQSGIHLCKELTKGSEKLWRVWCGFGKLLTGKKRKKPDEASNSVFGLDAREEPILDCWNHARENELRRSPAEMSQSLALHVNKGFFPRWMHDFQDKRSTIGREQLKIVVIFAGKRPRCDLEAIKIPSDPGSV